MRSPRRWAAAVCLCLVATLVTTPDAASALPIEPPADALPATVTVPLITGDTVTVHSSSTGAATLSTMAEPRPNKPVPRFESYTVGDSTYVIPEDAAPHVRAGRLDRALFDVTALIRDGFAGASAIPVIASGPLATALAGATTVRSLESINATALTVPTGQAAEFFRSLDTAALGGGGISKLWLDRPVRADLDRSVPKVGAPAAWQAGLDGTGVKVAVLDTGIDLDHPDFAGRIAETRDFTGKGTVQDGHFHGTHVASIAAGRGTAAGGKYTGVAPGARLVVGKVLGDNGSGAVSQIIDGMEWAVASGAKVVNLSLGAAASGPDGSDPMVVALDRLSQTAGTLFVVAAGNHPPGTPDIDTPGIAASALTVSAVDTNDAVAAFSNRGPLPYDNRILKPDLAAPGVGIAAARAAGTNTTPVDEHYTRASGTSMATPHVAGAAAILAGQHPDWTGAQLKAALLSASADVNLSAFVQGAGRLDVRRAITQRVVANSTVDFGRVNANDNTPITRTITYANQSATDLTLRLTTAVREDGGGAVPAGTVTTPDTVTVPAGGSVEVPVRLESGALRAGLYSGTLTATDEESGEVVRTPIGFDRSNAVRVEVTGRGGEPCGTVDQDCRIGYVSAYNLDKPEQSVVDDEVPPGGVALRLAPGRYRIYSSISWRDQELRAHAAFLVQPEVRIDGAATVKLDARQAVPVTVRTSRPSEPYQGTMTLQRPYPPPGERPPGLHLPLAAWVAAYGNVSFWATPTASTTTGGFLLINQQDWGAPLLSAKIAGGGPALHPSYFGYPWVDDPAQDPRFKGKFTAPVVDVGSTLDDPELPAVRGALILLSRSEIFQTCDASPEELTAAAGAGARGILLFDTGQLCPFFPLSASSQPGGVPIASLPVAEGQALRDLAAQRQVRLTVSGTPISPYLYGLKFYERTSIPKSLSYRVSDSELARVPTSYHADQPAASRRHNGVFWGPDEPTSYVVDALQLTPLRREELMGPLRDGQDWRRTATYLDLGASESVAALLRPGRMPAQAWFAAPRVPGAALPQPTWTTLCTACRKADTLYFVPRLTHSDPAIGITPYALPADVHLYAGDTELPATPHLGFPAFAVPPAPARLRLTHDWRNGNPEHRYSTRVLTTWQFDSRRPTAANTAGTVCLPAPGTAPCAVQPLTFLRYATATSLDNRIPRFPSILTVSPYREPATTGRDPRLSHLTVEVSFDGTTWRRAFVWPWHTEWHALLPTPPTGATTVSLRLTATDTTNATITQEIHDAYGIEY